MKYDDDDLQKNKLDKRTVPVTNIRELRAEQDRINDEEYEKIMQQHTMLKRIGRICAALFLVIAICYGFYYFQNVSFHGYATLKESEQEFMSGFQTVLFADGYLVYNNDGMSYCSKSGKKLWTKTYEMNHPKPFICQKFLVMADIGAKKFVICNTDGFQGEATSPLPLSTLSISAYGVVALVGEDDAGNHILVYDSSGSKLDIDIRTLMDQSGYPISISFSPDGKLLMASFVYLDQAIVNNKIVFYNFQDSAASTQRLVGTFQNYGDTLFGRVYFLDDRRAVALGDGKLVFYSLKNRMMPSQVSVVEFDKTIVKIVRNKTYLAVVSRDEIGGKYEITMLNANGEVVGSFTSEFIPDNISMEDDFVYFHDETRFVVLRKKGGSFKVKYDGYLSGPVRIVLCTKKDSRYQIISDAYVKEIELRR